MSAPTSANFLDHGGSVKDRAAKYFIEGLELEAKSSPAEQSSKGPPEILESASPMSPTPKVIAA
jgi:hypothetical protein